MEFNTEVRKKQLESLDQYISSSRDKVQSILDSLGWTVEKLLQKDERIPCSVDKNHLIHPQSSKNHVKNCRLIKEGYDLNEQFLSEPPSDGGQSVIKIDHHTKIDVLNKVRQENPSFKAAWNGKDPDPRTSDRFFSTFSTNERLALYDYAVANTKGPPPPAEFNVLNEESREDNENKVLTPAEIRALERDAKRRQVKYKVVHTNHKTHTEIMKQVIEGQMSLYVEWLNKKHQESAQPVTPDCDDVDIKKERKDQFSPQPEFDNTRIGYDSFGETSRCPSANSKYSNSGSLKEERRRYRSDYKRKKRSRSPSEYSNTSSNTSSRKDREKRPYASHSRHSSIDSLKSIPKRYKEDKFGNGEYKKGHSRDREKYENYSVKKHNMDYKEYGKHSVSKRPGEYDERQSQDYEQKYSHESEQKHFHEYEQKHSREYKPKHSQEYERKHCNEHSRGYSHDYAKRKEPDTRARHCQIEVKKLQDKEYDYQRSHRDSHGSSKHHHARKSDKYEYSSHRRGKERSRDRGD